MTICHLIFSTVPAHYHDTDRADNSDPMPHGPVSPTDHDYLILRSLRHSRRSILLSVRIVFGPQRAQRKPTAPTRNFPFLIDGLRTLGFSDTTWKGGQKLIWLSHIDFPPVFLHLLYHPFLFSDGYVPSRGLVITPHDDPFPFLCHIALCFKYHSVQLSWTGAEEFFAFSRPRKGRRAGSRFDEDTPLDLDRCTLHRHQDGGGYTALGIRSNI